MRRRGLANWRGGPLLAGALLVLAVAAFGPALAEPVMVRAASHDGYGRIVFNWPEPVSFRAETVGGQLVVRFSSPIEPILGGVVRNMKKYLSSAAAGADGRSAVFTLKDDFEVSAFDMGSAVVVDITGAVPAETKPAEEEAAAVRVRSGIHDGYTRIVFDWPERIPYRLTRKGGEATIDFSRPARLGLNRLQRRPPKRISAIRSVNKEEGPSVTLSVPENARIRHFHSGPKIVIDVMKPAAKAKPEKKTEVVVKKPEPAKPAPKPKTEPRVQDHKPVQKPEQKQERKGEETPTALTPPGRTEGAALPEGGKVIKASAVDSGPDAVGIRIDWDEPVAAAVFRRHGFLWVVFDKPTRLNVADVKAAGGNIIRSLEQLPNQGASVLRMQTVAGVNPNLKRDGLAWILEFRKQPFAPINTIDVIPQPNSPVGARLFASVTEPGRAIALTDPAVGDNLVVVPVIPLGYGIARQSVYPQARILTSSQGLAIQPRADDVRVRSLRQGVEVTSASGLQISAVSAAQVAANILDQGQIIRALTRMLDMKEWRQTGLETFREDKWKYQAAVAQAKPTGREEARLDLARFYFAHGFGPETLGVLRRIREDRPEIVESQEFRGLRGATNVMMRRFDDARADLDQPGLEKNDEARFWRAVMQAYEGDLYGASSDLRRLAAIIRPYPKALKTPLGTLVAEAAIKMGDIKQGTKYLDALKTSAPNPAEASQIGFVDGRLKELSGDFEGAVSTWEEVEAGPHRPSRAKAAVARTELLLKLKEIDEFQAIQELEKLRFAWRGDDFEFELLRRLGDLYVAAGDYRNGLRTMRQAATYFRDNEKAPEVTQQMTDAFSGLYLENKADNLAPVTAIALYDEFKELTPPGESGDEMIRRLADRLVDVDLLDRAAELLQGQIAYRLEGVEKARVGTQLALVHVLANEFDQAMDVLDESGGADLPQDLEDQRRHLRARSLMGLERQVEALALLDEDDTRDADLLRLEMFWNDKQWVQVSKVLNRILRGSGAKPGQPLDEMQGQTVLNMAVAMTLSGNERGIDRLRRDHGRAMDDSRFREAFRLIASPDTIGLISYDSIAGKVSDVEGFKTFMQAYQDRLKEGKLSAIN